MRHEGSANQNSKKIPLRPPQDGKIKEEGDLVRMRRSQSLLHCWWKGNRAATRDTVCRFFKKLAQSTTQQLDSWVTSRRITMSIKKFKYECSYQHYSSWSRSGKNSNVYQLINGLKNVAYLHNGIVFSEMKCNSDMCLNMGEPWNYDAKWNRLEKKKPYIAWFHLYELPRIAKSRETQSTIVAGRNLRGGREKERKENRSDSWCAQSSFVGWWKCSESRYRVVMTVQLCENTKNQWSVHFKRMNFMVCGLNLSKAVIKNIKQIDY